jgi:hypothetical protein
MGRSRQHMSVVLVLFSSIPLTKYNTSHYLLLPIFRLLTVNNQLMAPDIMIHKLESYSRLATPQATDVLQYFKSTTSPSSRMTVMPYQSRQLVYNNLFQISMIAPSSNHIFALTTEIFSMFSSSYESFSPFVSVEIVRTPRFTDYRGNTFCSLY